MPNQKIATKVVDPRFSGAALAEAILQRPTLQNDHLGAFDQLWNRYRIVRDLVAFAKGEATRFGDSVLHENSVLGPHIAFINSDEGISIVQRWLRFYAEPWEDLAQSLPGYFEDPFRMDIYEICHARETIETLLASVHRTLANGCT